MKQLGASLNLLGLGGLLLATAGCGGQAADGTRIGGETNWLLSCNTDNDCTVGQCLCNVCTVECVSAADSCSAGPPGSSCAIGSELGEGCADQLPGGICMLAPTAGAGLPTTTTMEEPTANPASSLDALLEALAADLEALDPSQRPYSRYVTVAHLREAEPPGDFDNLARGRRVVTKLANSLSVVYEASVPTPIDAEQLILRVDLQAYGWDEGLSVDDVLYPDGWEAIVAHASRAVEYQGPAADRLRVLSGTAVPWLFADDFVAAASVGNTYYELLRLPDNLAELQAKLENEALAGYEPVSSFGIAPGRYRAGFDNSGVSYNPRALERRGLGSVPDRYFYWQAFDFRSESRGDAVFSDPIGFVPDATEVIFRLPNRLFGFFIADADGRRVSESPLSPETILDPAQPDRVIRNAASCFGCHTTGPIPFTDAVRALWDSPAVPSELADPAAVLEAYPSQSVLEALMSIDTEAYARALERVGVARNEPDPISRVFVDAQSLPLGTMRAAGELLVTPEFLRERLSSLPAAIQALAGDAGRVPRPDFAAAYRDALCVLHQASANRPVGCP